MYRDRACVVGLMVVMCSFAVLSLPTPVSADIYMITGGAEGLNFHNGTNISLTNAEVWINISRTSRIKVVVDFSSRFQLESNLTQNATLAFAYPCSWIQPSLQTSTSPYMITVNREPVNYQICTWEDLNFTYTTDTAKQTGTWFEDSEYAVFDVLLDGHNSTEIDVSRQLQFEYLANEFRFEYIVASARSFSGNTHQIVNIAVQDDPDFLSVTFNPGDHLAEWTSGDTRYAQWDFTVQETSIDRVYVSCAVAQYHGSTDVWSNNDTPDVYNPWPLVISLVAITVLAIVLLIRIRYTLSQPRS